MAIGSGAAQELSEARGELRFAVSTSLPPIGHGPTGEVGGRDAFADVSAQHRDPVEASSDRPGTSPVGCRARRSGLVERADAVGARLTAGLHALMGDGLFSEVRGVGAIWAAQIAGDDVTARGIAIRDQMLELGVIYRAVNGAIAFCPPLVIDDADIDTVFDVCGQAVRGFR